jgi:DNA-binding beta-propeller fold protein YncE
MVGKLSAVDARVLTLDRSFGESGRAHGQYRLPRFITAMPDGNLCISDSVNLRLQIVTPDGEFVQSIGSPGTGPGQLRGNSGVACEGGLLFVVEGGNHRVQKLALSDGSLLAKAGSHGSKKGEMWCPQGCAFVKAQNTLFVADHINGRIVVFDTNTMEHIRSFGSRGTEPGCLEYPCDMALKGEEVFVTEFGNHRVSVFTKRGVFVRILGSEGKAPGQFFEPRGVAIVKGWVVVTEARRVQVLSPEGESRQVLEIPGAGSLWGVCKDELGRAYVTDVRAGHAKVYVLNVSGQSYEEGQSASVQANAAAQKAAEAAAKLHEWKESKMHKAASAEPSIPS